MQLHVTMAEKWTLALIVFAALAIVAMQRRFQGLYDEQVNQEIEALTKQRDMAEAMYSKMCHSLAHVIELGIGSNCTEWYKQYVDVKRRDIEAAAHLRVEQNWDSYNIKIITSAAHAAILLGSIAGIVLAVKVYCQIRDERRKKYSLPTGNLNKPIKVD